MVEHSLEHPRLVAALFLGILSLVVGFIVFLRRSVARARELCAAGARALEASRPEEALAALLAAERAWAFVTSGGPGRRDLSALDTFDEILGLLSRVPAMADDAASLAELKEVSAALRALFSDPANFTLDGQRLLWGARMRRSELCSRLDAARWRLRARHPDRGRSA